MSRRRLIMATAAIAVVAVVVIGLTQTGTDNSAPVAATISQAQIDRAFVGAPGPLAALHGQANTILEGNKRAVRDRLRELHGHPVVVNKWASWCGPCRFEFPFLQQASVKYAKRVAFVGLNSGDNRGDAQRFLKKFPLAYPSYEDPNEKTALALGIGTAYPTTIYYDARGRKQFVHQGGYATEAKLLEDVERYALDRAP